MGGGNPTTRTPEKEADFLEALMESGNVKASAKIAGIPRMTVYQWRDADQDFRKAWAEALEIGIDAIEDEATRRGADGYLKPVFQGGVQVGEVREYSDTLLIFMLKGRRPEKYKDRTYNEQVGKDGGPVEFTNMSDQALDAKLAALQKQIEGE